MEEEKEFELDKWFTSLTIPQKERIATKIHRSVSDGNDCVICYPECTDVWNNLPVEKKQSIHDHCTDAHGYLLPQWREGNGMSY